VEKQLGKQEKCGVLLAKKSTIQAQKLAFQKFPIILLQLGFVCVVRKLEILLRYLVLRAVKKDAFSNNTFAKIRVQKKLGKITSP